MKLELPIINQDNNNHGLEVLENLYKNKIIPREKKPYIIDYKKSMGPYMALAGSETRYLLDASSQIASLTLGFNPTALFGCAHIYSNWTNDLYSETANDIKRAFKYIISKQIGLKNIGLSFTNSGSESNELAFIMSYNKTRNDYPNSKKVLAFEGSFHGRMLTSLFSTWNKTKREPFEIPGKETTFVPYPHTESRISAEATKDLCQLFENPKHQDFDKTLKDLMNSEDSQLVSELQSLERVKKELETQSHYCVIIEPMQCEGGDRYSTNRFYNLLVLLCKCYSIPIIFDEVQTGFHLSKNFFWFKNFMLRDSKDNEIFPDYLTSAKKSQTGFTVSFDGREVENEEVNLTSICRGLYQSLASIHRDQKIKKVEDIVKSELNSLCKKFDQFENPRFEGLAFSFDIKDKDDVQKFINLRFDLGLLIYPAGERTLRFRLNTSFNKEEIRYLFHALDQMAEHIYHGEEITSQKEFKSSITHDISRMYNFHEKLVLAKKNGIPQNESMKYVKDFFKENFQLDLILFDEHNFESYKDQIQKIQELTYEPLRQTSLSKFQMCAQEKKGVCIGIVKGEKLCGISFSAKASLFPDERGLRRVRYFEHPESLYMLDTTVINEYQGSGLGKYLKYALELLAISRGHQYIYGRNRYKLAGSMLVTNLSLGAIPEIFIEEDYLDDLEYRDVIIYRSHLNWKRSETIIPTRTNSTCIGINPTSISDDFIKSSMPSLINKVCLSNFISLEYTQALLDYTKTLPKELQYIFTASGHSECVDKIYKSLFFSRKEDKKDRPGKLLTLKGHNFGLNSTLSRSLSCESFDLYSSHQVDLDIDQIKRELDTKNYLCFFIEISTLYKDMDQKSILNFLKEVKSICGKTNTHLCYDVSATHIDETDIYYGHDLMPDGVFMYLGGQMAICALREELRVYSPLMMISTWDGDEFSLHQKSIATFKSNEEPAGMTRVAQSLYHVHKDRPWSLQQKFKGSGIYKLSDSMLEYIKGK